MPKRKRHVQKSHSSLLILAGVALLLIGIFTFKNSTTDSSSSDILEQQLDQALKEGQPTFVFLHSLNCVACKEMMTVVDQVYPKFQDSIVLIDVDVYDQRNTNVLRREQVQSIPTLVFYNRQGARQVFIGAMSAGQFYDALTGIATEN